MANIIQTALRELTYGEKLSSNDCNVPLLLFKLNSLKTTWCVIGILTVVCGCNLNGSKKKPVSDTLEYIAPVPDQLSNEEYNWYNEILTSYFDSMLLTKNFNGAVLVAKAGNVLYEKYSGNIHVNKDEPITDSTSFQLASTSKTFTAVAILRLVQENKLKLTDTLGKFFPGLPYYGITVKMLLNHHSGLPNYLYFIADSVWDKHQNVTNQDVLDLLFSLQPPAVFEPGSRFNYNNSNFVLLALIIEKLTGKSYADYMNSKFFKPLHMDHTFVFTAADSARATPSYNYNNRLWQNDFLEMTYGDKNIYSTPRDLLKWDQALYTDQLINKQLKDSAFAPYIFNRESLPAVHNYGLGFHLMLTPTGKKVIFHFGRWHGFNAAFSRLTDEKATIIILGNKFNRNIYHTALEAYNLFGSYLPHHDVEDEEQDGQAEHKKYGLHKTYKKKMPSKSVKSKK